MHTCGSVTGGYGEQWPVSKDDDGTHHVTSDDMMHGPIASQKLGALLRLTAGCEASETEL